MTDQPTPPRKLTRAECGRLGGTATLARHGREHFVRAAKLGGAKGGQTTRDRYGIDFYRRIGAKGGARNGRKN